MQDVQNIPNPDVDSIEDDGDFGSHSDKDAPNPDVDQPKEETPAPTDRTPRPAIEEPTDEDDPNGERQKQIL